MQEIGTSDSSARRIGPLSRLAVEQGGCLDEISIKQVEDRSRVPSSRRAGPRTPTPRPSFRWCAERKSGGCSPTRRLSLHEYSSSASWARSTCLPVPAQRQRQSPRPLRLPGGRTPSPPYHEVGGLRAERRHDEHRGEHRNSAVHLVTSPIGRTLSPYFEFHRTTSSDRRRSGAAIVTRAVGSRRCVGDQAVVLDPAVGSKANTVPLSGRGSRSHSQTITSSSSEGAWATISPVGARCRSRHQAAAVFRAGLGGRDHPAGVLIGAGLDHEPVWNCAGARAPGGRGWRSACCSRAGSARRPAGP